MPERARLSIDENEATPKAPSETVPQCSQQEVMEDHLSKPGKGLGSNGGVRRVLELSATLPIFFVGG